MAPKLRFAEFLEDDGWKNKQLKDACQMQAGKFVSASEIHENRSKDLYPCYGGNGLRGYTKSYTHNGKYSLIGRQGALCGNITLVTGNFHATEHALVATPKDGINTDWLYFKLLYLELNQYATGQAQPGLSVENLEKIDIKVPRKEKEQQKIAACLTSLDDLITAQSEKIKALQAHKKGLMQQLFPAEGEMVPRVRFEEFEGKGDWKECQLGEKTTKVGSGITPKGGDKTYKNVGRPFVRSQNVGWGCLILEDIAFIDETTHLTFSSTEINQGDVLLNITGASIGRSAIADTRIKGGNVNQHVCIIRTKKELSPFFLNQYLLSNYGQKQIDSFQAGGNRQGLNFAQIRSLLIPLPPTFDEQQKIAACLTSLDDLITAQSQKLEALKAQKKGLMQGVFPGAC